MRYIIFAMFCIWIAYAFIGCTKVVPESITVVPSCNAGEIMKADGKCEPQYKSLWPNQQWTNELSKALDLYGKDLLATAPYDFQEWCWNKYDDKKQFYINLFSAMAFYESTWKTSSSYTEPNIFDKKGNHVISVGLMQVSSESCAGYQMPYVPNTELREPTRNFECTVRIANKWIPENKVIAQGFSTSSKGLAKYWSVVRTGSIHKREQIKKMICKENK